MVWGSQNLEILLLNNTIIQCFIFRSTYTVQKKQRTFMSLCQEKYCPRITMEKKLHWTLWLVSLKIVSVIIGSLGLNHYYKSYYSSYRLFDIPLGYQARSPVDWFFVRSGLRIPWIRLCALNTVFGIELGCYPRFLKCDCPCLHDEFSLPSEVWLLDMIRV